MKLQRSASNRPPQQQGFFLVIVMLILAAILLLYSAANARRLANLRDEIRLVERQQVQRLKLVTQDSTLSLTNKPGSPAVRP